MFEEFNLEKKNLIVPKITFVKSLSIGGMETRIVSLVVIAQRPNDVPLPFEDLRYEGGNRYRDKTDKKASLVM